MAWHILRKDLALLWPLVLLSVVAQFGLDALMFMSDSAPHAQYLLLTARLFVAVVFLVIALTIAVGVHQEPIPGTRQDWLIRPVKRVDLLLAKLLFILVAVQLPMFAGDLVEALAQGFSFGHAAAAAIVRNLYVLVTISLPAFALAAMTRNMAQFIGAGVTYFLGITVATVLLSSSARISGQEQATNPMFWTGVAWVPHTAASLTLTVGSLAGLAALYFSRRILLARTIVALFAAASVLATFLPWSWIFAVQESASASPAPGQAVTLVFDPAAPRRPVAPDQEVDDYSAGAAQVQLRGRSAGDIAVENKARHALGDVTIFLPLRAKGLPAGALLWVDRGDVTLRSEDGQLLFRGRGEDLDIRQTSSGSGDVQAYQAVRLPALLYEAARSRRLALEIDYSLSLLHPRPPVTTAALGSDQKLPRVGRCSAGRDSDGDDIELRCLQAGRAPSCVTATIEDPQSGRRNPETLICAPDYSPYNSRPFPDAISRFEVEAPFRDRLALANYPVSGPQLGRARVVLTAFDPQGHFTRHVTAAGVRLADWAANGGGTPPG